MQTLPSMLGFLFSNTLISSLMIFTLPVQFSSTREAHLSQAKYTPRILSLLFHTNPQKVSVQFCLLPSHIASDFIRLISRPDNVENSAKIPSACCISCSSLKNIYCSCCCCFYDTFQEAISCFPVIESCYV